MRKLNDVNIGTERNYKRAILRLYLKITEGERNFKMQDFIKENKISGSLITMLKKNRFIVNNGTPTEPNWKWIGILPNDKMIEKTIFEVRKYNRNNNEKRKEQIKMLEEKKLTNELNLLDANFEEVKAEEKIITFAEVNQSLNDKIEKAKREEVSFQEVKAKISESFKQHEKLSQLQKGQKIDVTVNNIPKLNFQVKFFFGLLKFYIKQI
jgi:hypothetical protein